MRSITASSGFISCAEISTAICCSRAIRASSATTSCSLRMSRLASGSSSSSSRGRLISAWAISTRCCSPPERLPTRVSAKLAASTASSISSTSARRVRGGQRHAEPVAVEAEPDEVAGAQRQVGVEQDLLGDVADQRVASRAGAAVDQDAPRARRLQAEDDAEQRRLAGAVGADQAGELAGRDREADLASRISRPDSRTSDLLAPTGCSACRRARAVDRCSQLRRRAPVRDGPFAAPCTSASIHDW